MLHFETPSPVASRFFSSMMGVSDLTPIRFGFRVGVEDEDDSDAASMSGEAIVGSNEVPPAVITAKPFVKSKTTTSIRDWLVHGLGRRRGVMSAWPHATGLKPTPTDRALMLDQSVASGYSWWWLHKIKKTSFSRQDSYQHRPNEMVYRVGGEPATGWNWFPRGTLYGMEKGVIDSFLHFGLTVSAKYIPVENSAPDLETQISYCAISIYMELDAATHGVAPPVFAAMLVFDNDDYPSTGRSLDVEATGPFPEAEEASNENSSNVIGVVVASQLHTFRLSDMLRAYKDLRPEENHLLVQKQIQDATVDIAKKLYRLATIKIVKLNLCASNIVFCPHLSESEGEDWVLLGFGFKTATDDLVSGKPHLSEFDPRLCKRMAGQTDYDHNCMFVLMVAIMLAAVKAEFGAGVCTLMLRALLNLDTYGNLMEGAPASSPLAQSFTASHSKVSATKDMLLRAFQHSRIERNPVEAAVFEEVSVDLVETLTLPVTMLGQSMPGARPRFNKLVLNLVNAREYASCGALNEDELEADQMQSRRHRATLNRVIRERQNRIRARAHVKVSSSPLTGV